MKKKLIAFAATALFSLNASAGYIQYDLHFDSEGSGLEGFIIQHDTDQSIALFSLRITHPAFHPEHRDHLFAPASGEGGAVLESAYTHFKKNGPTSLDIGEKGENYSMGLGLSFSQAAGGGFTYSGNYFAQSYAPDSPTWPSLPPGTICACFTSFNPISSFGTLTGSATLGTVDPSLAIYLDSNGGYAAGVQKIVPHYVEPNDIPEPTSIALLTLGAAGLAGAVRRRKPAM